MVAVKQRLSSIVRAIWDGITRPNSEITVQYDRTGARLLAFLSFVSLCGTLLGCFLAALLPYKPNGLIITFSGIPLSMLIYVLSRTRYYRLALVLSTIINFVAMYVAIQLSAYPPLYAIGMVVPLIVASLFWSMRPMLVALIFSSLAVASIIGFEFRLNLHLYSTLLLVIVPTLCTVYITHLRQKNAQTLAAQTVALTKKEAHYRSLFELSPVSLWEEDFSEVRAYLETLRAKAKPTLEAYMRANPEEVKACMARIRVTHVNQATVKLYEAEGEEDLLRHLDKIIHNDKFDVFVAELMAIAEGRHEYSIADHDLSYTLKGNRLDVSLRWVVIPGYEQDMSRVVVAIEDITDRKRLENERLELRLERERMNLLRHFIGDVSHDLNTSLTVLRTSLYLLEKQSSSEQAPRLQTMDAQVTRLEKMIQDMVMTSRLDNPSHEEFMFKPINVSDWVKSIAANYQALAVARQQTLHVETSAKCAMLDTDFMERALANLLDNAIKYTPEGGQVKLKAQSIGSNVIVEVQDNGAGIPPKDLPHIFERFYRADDHRPTASGMGLGLTIASKIVLKHNGTLDVESEVGKGTIFRITIPAYQPIASVAPIPCPSIRA